MQDDTNNSKTITILEYQSPDATSIPSHEQLVQWGLRLEQEQTLCALLQRLKNESYPAVLLNLIFGRPGALKAFAEVREIFVPPIYIFTDRFDPADRILAYEMGATDFFTTEHSPRELVTRVRAGIRRHQSTTPEDNRSDGVMTHDDLCLNSSTRTVIKAGEPLDLTRTEFDLLERLMRKPGQVFTRHCLLEGVNSDPYAVLDRTVDVHIASLRRKLGDPSSHPKYIRTARGLGYAFLTHSPRYQ